MGWGDELSMAETWKSMLPVRVQSCFRAPLIGPKATGFWWALRWPNIIIGPPTNAPIAAMTQVRFFMLNPNLIEDDHTFTSDPGKGCRVPSSQGRGEGGTCSVSGTLMVSSDSNAQRVLLIQIGFTRNAAGGELAKNAVGERTRASSRSHTPGCGTGRGNTRAVRVPGSSRWRKVAR